MKIFTDNIDDNALEQIKELLSVDVFSDKKIRIMPDVHSGTGCVIGFTGDLGDKVIPNIVGVDIGCGMRVLRLGNISDIDFHAFHLHINSHVPSGMIVRGEDVEFEPYTQDEQKLFDEGEKMLKQLYCFKDLRFTDRLNMSLGSLGGGNHFIELDKDDEGNIYLVIHTGSRNLGKQVADFYQKKAVEHLTAGHEDLENRIKRMIDEFKAAGRQLEIQSEIKKMHHEQEKVMPSLPDKLCYVEGKTREDYLHDMRICQRWAILNRRLIAKLLMKFFDGATVVEEWESVHNYISDDNIIRKGSISAAKGQKCIIPLNMRDGSLICTGKGNPDWNCSAPHGAGRVLSRTQAYEMITMEDFEASMAGIYSESVTESTRDESPMVYKPADEIIANIGDTVNIDTIIRPIFNFKAS